MKYIKLILMIFVMLGLFHESYAYENYKFRTMSPDGGFYFDGVKFIEQDNTGFIWIMMDYELYRFDGYQYKKYYPHFAAMEYSRKWVFHNMTTDSSGGLFVNTENGLYSYNQSSDNFERIYDGVVTVKTDNKNNIWVWTNTVWSIFDASTGTLNTPVFDGESVSYTNPVFCTYNNDLYVFIGLKVYRFNYTKNEFIYCFTIPSEEGSVRFAKAHQGKLYAFVNKGGLYKIDLSTFNVEMHYESRPEQSINSLRTFYVDKKGYVWYGTINGLYIFDPVSQKYTHYTHVETNPFSLPNNSIWTINEDNQQNLWIGTYSGALCYVNLDESNAFKTYLPQNSGLNHTPVSSFAEDQKYLWIGTEGGGINRMNKDTGEFSYLTSQNGLTYNNVKSLVIDSDNNLWISQFMGGIDFYDTKQSKITNYKRIPGDSTSLLVNDIRKTVLENNSGLWVAYQNRRSLVSFFSFKDKKFTHFPLDADDEGKYLFDILRQGEKYLWALSDEKLYCMDIQNGETRIMSNDSVQLGFYTFCLDDSGNIWIGTIGNGLIKFDPNTSKYEYLNDFLHQNIYSIYSICYDDGVLWMGTDNGLYCYNIAKTELLKFDEGEGTQGQVYYPLAALKGRDGKLYFGGTNGFTIIKPKEIIRNQNKPNIIISDFFIDHKSTTPVYSSAESLDEIILQYDQTNFGFQFSSDSYHIPEKNLFRYRLRGYDERWFETDAFNRTAMYSKVPAGTYYFEVVAANNDGAWNDVPKIIRIVRKPAPWFSWPAYIFYGLITLGIIWLIYRYYDEKKKLKMQLYVEGIEKDKKEQIHQAQLRFFTNISHDFRTPLSLIVAVLDKLRQEGLKEYYYRILHGNTQRLLNLVNELMDFRTVENGKMKLGLQSLDINSQVREIADDFTDYASQRNINFLVECDPELPVNIYADKHIIEKTVMNLLNNAFKYTPNGGTITLQTKACGKQFVSKHKNSYSVGEMKDKSATYSIIISDTGVGISGESIKSVFERFYKVNTSNTDLHLGTGIGLALVKSLVLLHKGNITLYSERNIGSEIVVYFPMDSSIFDATDFMRHEDIEQEAQPDSNMSEEINGLNDMEQELLLSNKKRILLAEDNVDFRVLVAYSLDEEYEVIQAGDGLEASNLIDRMDFDLIISDIMMPYKDGVTLCQEVKNDINTSHIPLVLLTAKTSLESKIEGVDSGADMYFEKPIDLTYLKLSIQNIFRNQQLQKDYYAKNYFADTSQLSTNEQDSRFLRKFIEFIEANLDQSEMDVNQIATELSMSKSKLYTKVKSLTGKSVVEFVLNYRLRKAAKLIIEEDMTMREIMMQIGIESQAYFTNSFKKIFGETPTSFATKYKKKK